MGRKAEKYKKKEDNDAVKKKTVRFNSDDEDMMDDEIDAFHKNRDVVPLDLYEDMEDSDDDNEQPVFDLKDDEDEDDEDIDGDDDDDEPPKALEAKIIRTQKFMRAKFGAVEDEMLDDADNDDQERKYWGKGNMYETDVLNEPQSTDDEDAAAEEAEVERLQQEKLKSVTENDFGLQDTSQDESDREPTFEEILGSDKAKAKASRDIGIKDEDGMAYEIVEKDVNSLTKEEQMDFVRSSAPELIGLLSELNDALEELENKVNPLVDKIREREIAKKGGMHYMEVKQLLLQSFCQAITFYLLLKSEGQPVRDHPVVSRLVEIKSLLDKIKEMDDNLPFNMEDILKKGVENTPVLKLVDKTVPIESDSFDTEQINPTVPSTKQAMAEHKKETESNNLKSSKNNESQQKHQDKQVAPQSLEMLKIRASLEEKLKQKGVFGSVAPKNARSREHSQPMNRHLETLDDFVDEAIKIDPANGRSNGDAKLSHSSMISQQLTLHPNKRRAVSGDDDLPKRDDIGERRRKHELRVLAGAGIRYADDADDADGYEIGNLSSDGDADANEEVDTDSDLDYYKQVERQHAAKLAAKSNKYSRTPEIPSLPETVDGKRHITNQIEKNRGLTRPRKKEIKNPRKKYKLKHQKAVNARKGQVREVKKPTGPYGGEASGINAGISRSTRLRS